MTRRARSHAEPGQLSTDEIVSYTPTELQAGASSEHHSLDSLSSIEPLSSKSLSALNRLARYKAPPDPYPLGGRAAVMVALFGSRTGNNLNVLLSTRSETLRTFPGQVALPGGKMDESDLGLEATARREGESGSMWGAAKRPACRGADG